MPRSTVWGKGDPGGYLEINAPDVSYFDPFLDRRLDGLAHLTSLYESIRGKIQIDRDEIVNPRVQMIGDAAVLTIQYVSHGSEGTMHWNCTEVYQTNGRLFIRIGPLPSRLLVNRRVEAQLTRAGGNARGPGDMPWWALQCRLLLMAGSPARSTSIVPPPNGAPVITAFEVA